MACVSKDLLPPNIFDNLLCTNCGNYLSIGPVMVTPEEEIVCGRCPKPKGSTTSLYNVIAKKYQFNCVNWHGGCDLMSYFGEEMAKHENTCRYVIEFECPCCAFSGNGCELLYHFRKLHTNHVLHADTLNEVLSYHQLKYHAAHLMSMNAEDLRLFASTAVKIFSTCQFCRKVPSHYYICSGNHVACYYCSDKPCLKCERSSTWNKNTPLHRILLPCEWPDCSKKLNVFQYWSHKAECKQRRYKCPSKDCAQTGTSEWLQNHWHMNRLFSKTDNLTIGHLRYPYYWLTLSSDLYQVVCKRQGNGYVIEIRDEDAVYQPSVKFSVQISRPRNSSSYTTQTNWQLKAVEPVRSLFINPGQFKATIICRS